MDVTSTNFNKLLPQIKEAIATSKFISIDCLFSGIENDFTEPHKSPTISSLYKRTLRKAGDFLIFQFGLTTFNQIDSTDEYKASTFNFYLFPGAIPRFNKERLIKSQYSMVKHLANDSFDFNKLFCYGISYLSEKTEEELKEKRSLDLKAPTDFIEVDHRGKTFLEEARKDINKWYNSKKDTGYLVVGTTSRYCKRLVYQEIELNYDKKIIASGSRFGVRLDKFTDAASKKESAYQLKRIEKEVDELIGFRKIIDILISHQKPLVGHKFYLTLCHIYKHFIVEEFPESASEFNSNLSTHFPNIFDSFSLLNDISCEGSKTRTEISELSHLVETIVPKYSETTFETGFNKYKHYQRNLSHSDAGFNSFVVGETFINLLNHRAKENSESSLLWDNLKEKGFMVKYSNKVYTNECELITL